MNGKEFLKLHGQSAENVNAEKCVAEFVSDMKKGLEGSGGMPMIPTYLVNVDRSKIKKNVKRVLVDAGGTNFRSAVGYFDNDGKVRIENLQKTKMPASDEYLSKEEFYSAIAQNVSYLLPVAKDVGFCFSYQVNMDKDVDGEVVMFSKEINAPEVIGTRVGKETLNACKKLNGANRKIVILNDTVATLLGGMAVSDKKYSAYLGYIYGTGTNVCYSESTENIKKVNDLGTGEMLINTECGNFEGFPQGDFDVVCIKRTAVPNKQIFEKMTSGKYLADIIAEAFSAAEKENAFLKDVSLSPFDLKDVSSFLSGGEFPCSFASEEDASFAKQICEELVERAAKMGAVVNAAIAAASCKDKNLPVAIVAEGTTFNKLTGYRAKFERYLKEILEGYGITYEIIQGEELNLVGTLMATMVL